MAESLLASEPSLGPEAVDLLQTLLRFDTSNPPGNERGAQEHLRDLLAEAGFECELLARDPERPNLVARLRGVEPGPTLCYLGHVDTVPADSTEWTHGPFSGDLADGCVWGRGALDMKSQVAAELAAAAALARGGWRPARGELLVVVTADEEAGMAYGARWLCDEHQDKVRCDVVVNEGAGEAFEYAGRRIHTVCLGEKGNFLFQLRTRGRAGHASLPRIGDNALVRLAPLIERMGSRQPAYEGGPEVDGLVTALLGGDPPGDDPARLAAALRAVAEIEPRLIVLLEAMMGVTLVPTMIRASDKDNVIPSRAEATIACRVPPELGADYARERIAAVLGEGQYEVEFLEQVTGSRSPAETPLMTQIRAWLEIQDPGAELVPIVLPGFSDSHWFRVAFGAIAYGFFPQAAMSLFDTAPLVHAPDERIAAADVELAAGFFAWLAPRMLG